MATTEKAPGIVWRKRGDGTQVAYWAARPDLIKAGYRPKTVRLHYHADDPMMAARCHVLQAEMLRWSSEQRMGPAANYDGTFASLVRYYETHPDSPYHELEEATAKTYSKTMASLMKAVGARRVAAVDAADIRRWYKELAAAHSKGWAYFTTNVLKSVLSFGATKKLDGCKSLRSDLREAKFQAGAKRKEYLTYPQVVAFREAAHVMGCGWMALCLTLQFDFGMRRRDVIGAYFSAEPGPTGIRHRGKVWADGLTWSHIDEAGVLRKMVSKTRFTSEYEAAHMVTDYPSAVVELSLIPSERRVGPIILNAKGLPPTEAQCRYNFRRIARKAKISDDVWQMDARAGANTEAREAGATEEDAMALLTHSEAKTNRGYLRDLLQQSRRAAAVRVGSRKE